MTSLAPPDNGTEQPTRIRWLIFLLAGGTSWFLYLHRYTFALIKPRLQDELGLSSTQLGYMDSFFSITYAGLQFPAGLLADSIGVHWLLGGLILLWSVAMALHAWAPGIQTLYLSRLLFGAGQSGAYALLSRLTRIWFPASVRTTVQGWVGVFSGRFGGLCANIMFATLLVGIIGLDWRIAIYLLAGAGILHGIAFLCVYRETPRDHPWLNKAEVLLIEGVENRNSEQAGADTSITFRTLFGMMRIPAMMNLMMVVAMTITSTIADQIYSHWIPLFLSSEHGLNFKEMGIYSALPLLGGACGGAIGGFLTDRLIRQMGNRRWARSLIGAAGKAAAGITLAVALLGFYDNPYVFCGLLFLVKFFADISLATSWGTITDIGGVATASVFAFNNSVASLVGGAFSPIYGLIADSLYGWKLVFTIACASYFLCAFCWLFVNCTIPVLTPSERSSNTDRTPSA